MRLAAEPMMPPHMCPSDTILGVATSLERRRDQLTEALAPRSICIPKPARLGNTPGRLNTTDGNVAFRARGGFCTLTEGISIRAIGGGSLVHVSCSSSSLIQSRQSGQWARGSSRAVAELSVVDQESFWEASKSTPVAAHTAGTRNA